MKNPFKPWQTVGAIFFIFLGVILRFGCLPKADFMDPALRTPDEVIYTAYASVIAHEGPRGVRIAVEQYNLNPKLWIVPPPTRIGYLFPLAGAMKMSGKEDLRAGIYLSILFSCLSLGTVFLIGRRFFGDWAALAAVLFISVSPMELAFAGKCWQESQMTFLGGCLLWAGLEILANPRRWTWMGVFAAAGAWVSLSKESGMVLFGLAVLWVSACLLKNKRPGEAAWFFGSSAAALVAALAVLIALAGGWQGVRDVYTHVKQTLPLNTYAVTDQSGGWTSFIEGFLRLTPVTFVLFFLGAAFSTRKISALTAAILTVAFVVAASVPDYFKNMRYLSPIFIPYYLLAGAGAAWLAERAEKKTGKKAWVSAAFGILLLTVASSDYVNYRRIFVENKAKDLSLGLLKG